MHGEPPAWKDTSCRAGSLGHRPGDANTPPPQMMLPPSQLRELRKPSGGHTVSKWQRWDTNSFPLEEGFHQGPRQARLGRGLASASTCAKPHDCLLTVRGMDGGRPCTPSGHASEREQCSTLGDHQAFPSNGCGAVRAPCWGTEMAPQEDVHLRRNFLEGRADYPKNTLPG